ncbi:MAG: hypothetical protein Satyrvirus50_1 [Satyrvirus sp.]|uniref:Uncharacterized protein n=1 Tax=Satyrvirus sp. TaxID=2487771 RepID=A0A3G5AF44_9VIRU|nr:MAG: hypothetical protein Satyrvirus50_1 [Satyrvirus sp.]
MKSKLESDLKSIRYCNNIEGISSKSFLASNVKNVFGNVCNAFEILIENMNEMEKRIKDLEDKIIEQNDISKMRYECCKKN